MSVKIKFSQLRTSNQEPPTKNLQLSIDQLCCEWLANFARCPICHGLARPNILMLDDFDSLTGFHNEQRNNIKSCSIAEHKTNYQWWLKLEQKTWWQRYKISVKALSIRWFVSTRESEIKHNKSVAITENTVTAI